MLTLSELTARYNEACRAASNPYLSEADRAFVRGVAHDTYVRIQDLRHAEVTAHEAVCLATPSVHAVIA